MIKWGIIGCGDVTEKKSGPAFNKTEDSSLVAVMRRDAGKAEDYAKRHGVPKWYADADALINDAEVNAIYVATPPGSHEQYAVAAMRAGKPVYVEKPMSVNMASCQRMEQVSKETGVKLCIAHYRRALPMFLKIKELIQAQTIGDVRTVRLSLMQPDQSEMIAQTRVNWRVDPAIAGAGLFYDLAPHQLDIIIYFFGEPTEVFGLSAQQANLYEAEDAVTGVMRLPNNVLFSGQWCFVAGDMATEDVCEIVGSQGKISFPVFGHDVTITTAGGSDVLHFDPPAHIQQPMIEKVVNYFLGKNENPCSAADALVSMRVMEQFAYGK